MSTWADNLDEHVDAVHDLEFVHLNELPQIRRVVKEVDLVVQMVSLVLKVLDTYSKPLV